MKNVAIRTSGLSKRYRLGTSVFYHHDHLALMESEDRSEKDAAPKLQPHLEKGWIWAVRNLDIEVTQGEVLGIVGANGAGKTTLLKLLTRITAPTSGSAEIHGQVGSLLEIGTGFNWELTGRENVFLNGLILGMSRPDIAARFDEIVEFSGTETFIDTPMKRYSSGMSARLGFAVAAHLDAQILIVDEVLAVGDAAFQRKCIERMRSVASQSGRTVLFVSHNAETVLDTCSRAIWLKDGQLQMSGDPRSVLTTYLSSEGRSGGAASDSGLNVLSRRGNGQLRVTAGQITGSGDGNKVSVGGPLVLKLGYNAIRRDLITISFDIRIRDKDGRIITTFSTQVRGQDFQNLQGEGSVECRVERCPLLPGIYSMDIEVSWPGTVLDSLPNGLSFEVIPGRFFEGGFSHSPEGFVYIDHIWSSDQSSETQLPVYAEKR